MSSIVDYYGTALLRGVLIVDLVVEDYDKGDFLSTYVNILLEPGLATC